METEHFLYVPRSYGNAFLTILGVAPMSVLLRTVPTKYKGFCAKLGPRGKSRSLQGLLESTKKNRGSHAFFRDN